MIAYQDDKEVITISCMNYPVYILHPEKTGSKLEPTGQAFTIIHWNKRTGHDHGEIICTPKNHFEIFNENHVEAGNSSIICKTNIGGCTIFYSDGQIVRIENAHLLCHLSTT